MVTALLAFTLAFQKPATPPQSVPEPPRGPRQALPWRWREVRTGARPAARTGARMVYDGARDRAVLFGGVGVYSTPDRGEHRDTWEWTGARWLRRDSRQAPPHRHRHAMVVDSRRGRVVLFGGEGSSSSDLRGDTWEWDGDQWTERTMTSAPSPRADAAMAYDSARGVVVLFGGETARGREDDTWLYDGAAWRQATPARRPPARDGAAMAWDPRSRRVLLVGGSGRTDTWTWDGESWEPVPAAGAEPLTLLLTPALIYDPLRERMVLFGADTVQTWEFDGARWLPSVVTVPFTPRGYAAVAYDSRRRQFVVFGGGTTRALNDTWIAESAGERGP